MKIKDIDNICLNINYKYSYTEQNCIDIFMSEGALDARKCFAYHAI